MRNEKKIKRKRFLMIFSVGFSFFLWLYVLSSAQTQADKLVRMKYLIPKGFAIKNHVPKEVTFFIRGPRVFVRSLVNREDTYTLDLNDVFKKGKFSYTIPLSELGANLPFGVESMRIEPNKISVNLEKELIKTVPIKMRTYGEVPGDHRLTMSEVEPVQVTLSGPKSLISNIDSVETNLLELNGLTGKGNIKVPLQGLDDRIEMDVKTVEYKYEIKPTRANLILKNIPVRFLSSRIIKSANRRSVNLMVLADNGEKSNYGKNDIKVIAEVPDTTSKSVEVKLSAELPEGLHLLEIQPASLQVFLEK